MVTTLVIMSIRSEHVKAWRKATKERMVAAMGDKCQCCGYDRCVESLDFHHLNPEDKEMSLGAVRANPKAWEHIVNELRKCVLVCRNCHGELHYGVRQLPEVFARFDERYLEYKTHPELCDECPVCGKLKPKQNQVCSKRCGSSKRFDWSGVDLEAKLKTLSLVAIADELGLTQAAVWRRAKKMGLVIPNRPSKKERTFTPFVRPPKTQKLLQIRVSDIDPNWRHRPKLKNRKVERPSKEELTKMVWDTSLLAVGKKFGVGDNAVRKWCRAYSITLPPQGYAQRRQAGYSHEEALVSQKRLAKGKRYITRDIAARAYVLRAQGQSYRQIGDQLGFGHWSIQSALRRYGLENGCSSPARTGDSEVTAPRDATSLMSSG